MSSKTIKAAAMQRLSKQGYEPGGQATVKAPREVV